jgi:hypothetical protein
VNPEHVESPAQLMAKYERLQRSALPRLTIG